MEMADSGYYVCFAFMLVGMSEYIRIVPMEETKEFWSIITLIIYKPLIWV